MSYRHRVRRCEPGIALSPPLDQPNQGRAHRLV